MHVLWRIDSDQTFSEWVDVMDFASEEKFILVLEHSHFTALKHSAVVFSHHDFIPAQDINDWI